MLGCQSIILALSGSLVLKRGGDVIFINRFCATSNDAAPSRKLRSRRPQTHNKCSMPCGGCLGVVGSAGSTPALSRIGCGSIPYRPPHCIHASERCKKFNFLICYKGQKLWKKLRNEKLANGKIQEIMSTLQVAKMNMGQQVFTI